MAPSSNNPNEFQRFEALARRILTTPKAELMKNAPKKVTKMIRAKKRK
jgi:hypothetical protein